MNNNSGIKYPRLEIDVKKLRHNIDSIVEICDAAGISVAGVIKGFNGLRGLIGEYQESGCKYIATSRMEQIVGAIKDGITGPFLMVRVPMKSEIPELVKNVEYSLNSEIEIIDEINRECRLQSKTHKVILMVDLGDLREGFWDKKELFQAIVHIERDLPHVDFVGIGTNLGCYGSIKATPEKLSELSELAANIEEKIGRKLEIVSGGGTSSLPLVFEGSMPEGINHLRIGEGIILAYDLDHLFGCDMSFMHQDVFTLKAEIIEVKEKPSYPVGELSFDAFGNSGSYEDRGIRKKALIALGKVDFAFPEMLLPREQGLEVMGASSDHLIVDIQECSRGLKVGDIIEFDLCYATLVYATSSANIKIVYV